MRHLIRTKTSLTNRLRYLLDEEASEHSTVQSHCNCIRESLRYRSTSVSPLDLTAGVDACPKEAKHHAEPGSISSLGSSCAEGSAAITGPLHTWLMRYSALRPLSSRINLPEPTNKACSRGLKRGTPVSNVTCMTLLWSARFIGVLFRGEYLQELPKSVEAAFGLRPRMRRISLLMSTMPV